MIKIAINVQFEYQGDLTGYLHRQFQTLQNGTWDVGELILNDGSFGFKIAQLQLIRPINPSDIAIEAGEYEGKLTGKEIGNKLAEIAIKALDERLELRAIRLNQSMYGSLMRYLVSIGKGYESFGIDLEIESALSDNVFCPIYKD